MAIVWFVGFMFGRSQIKDSEPKIIFLKGETIRDSVKIPTPSETFPIDTESIIRACIEDGIYSYLFPEKIVEIEKYIPIKEDTLAVMKDWSALREYSQTLFENDTLGKMDISWKVQYNRTIDMCYEYQPIIKEAIKTKTPLLSPFIGVGAFSSSNGYNFGGNISGGIFFKEKYGVAITYSKDFRTNADYFSGQLFYKF